MCVINVSAIARKSVKLAEDPSKFWVQYCTVRASIHPSHPLSPAPHPSGRSGEGKGTLRRGVWAKGLGV